MPAMVKTQSDWPSVRHASQEIRQDMSEYGRHLMEAKSNRLKQQYNHFSNELGSTKKYERSISTTGVTRRNSSVPRGIKPAVHESHQFKIQKTSATLIPKTQSPNGSQSSIKGFKRRNSSHTSTKKVPQIKPPIDRKYVRNVMAI